LANTDIAVYKDEVLLTLTTHYTVTINANGTGSVTITATGLALSPTSPTQYAIVGNRTISRTTDFTTGGDFFANTLNDELDQQTIFAQQNAEGLQRALSAPQTDPTTINMVLPLASLRANKTLGFDATGNPTLAETLGRNRGNWASGTAYIVSDIAKDTTTNNIFQVITAHTSSGALPITTNADSAKWTLLVDAASATTSAAAAASSATAAAASASTASTQASNASTSASNASTSATSAASSATSATNSATTATTQASASSTSATAAASSATSAAASATSAAAAAASGMYSAVQDKSAAYTVVTGDAGDLIRVTTTAGAVTITLPLISGQSDGFKIAVVKWSSDANAVTVARSGSDTINGSTSYSIATQYSSATFVADFETDQWFAVSGLSGATTGSGSIVLATSPTITTPVISSIVNTGTLTLPTSTDTLVGRATTDTLTNKTLTSPTITGGALNGTLGATTPSTVAATSITASTTLGVTGTATLTVDASISGLTVGKGGGSGSTNTVVGNGALAASASNQYMTAIGNVALAANTIGFYATAVGAYALNANTTGTDNTAVGTQALDTNTTGSFNTGLGRLALHSNTTASSNTAVGYQAGYTGTTASESVYFGTQAGYSVATSTQNTLLGSVAGYSTTSAQNTFIGQQSGYYVTSGAKNTIIGRYSGNQGGLDIRTASNYIVLSDGDGNPKLFNDGTNWTNTGNTLSTTPTTQTNAASFIGNNTGGSFFFSIDSSTGGTFGQGAYQRNIYSTGTTYRIYVTAGNNGVYLAPSGTSWTSNSDERLKENLVPIENGLAKVASLRAVTGNYIADETKKSRAFLIAQDLQAVLPEAVDATEPEKLGVSYTDVIPLLVASIKELKTMVDAQAAEIAELKAKVA
jgi:hypothetical protein